MTDKSAVDAIAGLAREAELIVVEGETFSLSPRHAVYHDPRPETMKVRTLTGFVDYIKTQAFKDNVPMQEARCVVNVESHKRVVVITEGFGPSQKRHEVVVAELNRPMFEFNKFMDTEDFVIGLASLFLPTADLETILKYVGKLSIDTEIGTTDDGVTQRASVKKGISGGLTEGKTMPSRVTLCPYRTFSEVAQPVSDFVFRLTESGGQVKAAIFEADAGAWKNAAADNVKAFIMDIITELPVIA
jgi:hypothetical protein